MGNKNSFFFSFLSCAAMKMEFWSLLLRNGTCLDQNFIWKTQFKMSFSNTLRQNRQNVTQTSENNPSWKCWENIFIISSFFSHWPVWERSSYGDQQWVWQMFGRERLKLNLCVMQETGFCLGSALWAWRVSNRNFQKYIKLRGTNEVLLKDKKKREESERFAFKVSQINYASFKSMKQRIRKATQRNMLWKIQRKLCLQNTSEHLFICATTTTKNGVK